MHPMHGALAEAEREGTHRGSRGQRCIANRRARERRKKNTLTSRAPSHSERRSLGLARTKLQACTVHPRQDEGRGGEKKKEEEKEKKKVNTT